MYLNVILTKGPKKLLPQGPRLRPGWALNSYATALYSNLSRDFVLSGQCTLFTWREFASGQCFASNLFTCYAPGFYLEVYRVSQKTPNYWGHLLLEFECPSTKLSPRVHKHSWMELYAWRSCCLVMLLEAILTIPMSKKVLYKDILIFYTCMYISK